MLTTGDFEKLIQKILEKEPSRLARRINTDMSLFFTDAQKYIIIKKISGLPLSKSEREYYSRTCKKKIIALSTPSLHRAAELILLQR